MTGLAYNRTQIYGERPLPSSLSTSFTALGRPFYRSAYALQVGSDWAAGKPTDKSLTDAVNLLDYQLSHPDFSTGQNIANTVSGIAGTFLDPISLAAGGLVGKIVGKGVVGVASLVPDYVSSLSSGALSRESIAALMTKSIPVFENNKFAKFLPKGFNDALEKTAESAGLLAGFTLGESFLENYNADTSRLDYGGLTKSIAFNGGIGLAIPPLAWTAGVLIGKIGVQGFKELSPTKKIAAVEKALESGKINKEERDWLVNLYEKPGETQSHVMGSMRLLDKENHPINAFTGKIELPFMTQEEMKQMQLFALDQMASSNTSNYKRALSDFVSLNMLDRMVAMVDKNPSMLAGIRAHVEETEIRLAQKIEQLKKEDIFIEKTTPRSAVRSQPISQQKIYQMMQQGNLSEREMPFIVPDNVKKIRSVEDKVYELEQKSKNYEREFNKTNRTKFKKLKEKTDKKILDQKSELEKIKNSEGKILSQADELKSIREKILGKDELPKKYQISKDYLRLLDLAHVYPQARALLKQIEIREQYELQAAYNEVLKSIVMIAEQGMGKFANPERVINYFKERIEGRAEIESFKKYMNDKVQDVNKKAESIEKKAIGEEPIRANLEKDFNSINENPNISRELKEEFNGVYSRLDQFKKSNKALEDLVNCIMEAENVAI